MLKAILFDFDGTIVDSLRVHLSAWRKTFNHFGKNLTDEEIVRDAFYTTKEEFIEKFNLDPVSFFELYYKNFDEVMTELELHENFDKILDAIKDSGLKLAIISFAEKEYVQKHLTRLNLATYFNIVLGHNDAKQPKPHPEIAQKAMQSLGVSADETLLVGDTALDIQTGKNANIMTAFYNPEINRLYTDMELFRDVKPDFEFHHYDEFLPHIENFL